MLLDHIIIHLYTPKVIQFFVLLLRVAHLGFVSLASESPDSPVSSTDVLRIEVVEIPAQTTEAVLTRLEQDVHLVANSITHPLDVALHVILCVSGGDDWHLGFQ